MIRILKESIPLEVQQKFGHVLFGDIRGFGERDTEYERWVYRKVYRYFMGEGMGQNEAEDIVDAFQELLSIKPYYPDVLTPDVKGYLFRGFSLNTPSAIAAAHSMRLLDSTVYKVARNPQMAITQVHYTPRHIIESWTKTAGFAERMASVLSNPTFGDDEPKAMDTFITLQTKQYNEKELLFNSEFTNFLDREYGKLDEEDEIVRVSKNPIPVEAIIRIPKEGSPMDKLLGWHQ